MIDTMKRRVIYVSDPTWTRWQAQAAEEGVSVSAWLRNAAYDREFRTELAERPPELAVVDAPGFNTRPFTPVPKHGKR